jgi:hypothetical protein
MFDVREAATTLVLNVDVFSRVRGLELEIANPSAHLGFSKVLNEWANDGSYGPFKERISLEKISGAMAKGGHSLPPSGLSLVRRFAKLRDELRTRYGCHARDK